MTPGSRGGKARKMGPSETPEFCAAWEAHDTSEFTGSREMYAQVFRWGMVTERERMRKAIIARGGVPPIWLEAFE